MPKVYEYHVSPDKIEANLNKLQGKVGKDVTLDPDRKGGFIDHDGVKGKFVYDEGRQVLKVEIDHLPHIPFIGHKVETSLKDAFGNPTQIVDLT